MGRFPEATLLEWFRNHWEDEWPSELLRALTAAPGADGTLEGLLRAAGRIPARVFDNLYGSSAFEKGRVAEA